MNLQRRNPVFDIMRGIGILLVVLGHAGFPFSGWIYLFHMPLFFLLSGWFYKPEHTVPLSGLLHSWKSKVLTLWLPFVIANTAFTLCNNLFLRLNILTEDSRILDIPGNLVHAPVTWRDIVGRTVHWCFFDGGTQLGGALWFLQVLFQVSVLYAFVDFLLKRVLSPRQTLAVQTALALVFLGIGFACQRAHWSVWLLDVALSCYPLYHLGVLLRQFSVLPHRPPMVAAAGIGSAAGLCVLNTLGSVSLASNEYPNPFFLLVGSVYGWYMVYGAARLLLACGVCRRFFAFAGRHSRIVLILHLLCFKPVSWAGLRLTGGASYLLASFPVLFTGGWWWIPYTLTGLLLPLAIQVMFTRFRAKWPFPAAAKKN